MKRSPNDPPLPDELRAELLRSRQAARDYDVLGKLPQLRAALERSQPTIDVEGPSSPAEWLSKLGSTWKIVVVAAAIGTVTWIAWPAQRGTAPSASPEPQAPEPRESQPPPREVLPERDVAPAPANPETRALPTDQAVASAPGIARPDPPSSRREIEQLVRIRALLEHDPGAAYRLAQRSEREFPRGVLSEERQGLQVLALARSGAKQAAERKAREFLARHPQSPMRDQLEAALGR